MERILLGIQQYKVLFLIVITVLALFIASPMIAQLVAIPQTDFFTELSLLGPYHNATYPFNVRSNETYPLYLNVSNHLGASADYLIQIKFRNQTQSAADSFNHTYSDLPSLNNITFSLQDKETVEIQLNITFQFEADERISKVNFHNITVNGYVTDTSTSAIWDSQRSGFFGNLFFELWIFNGTINSFQYHQRYVSLWLKMDV